MKLVKGRRKLIRDGSSGLGTLVTEPLLGDTRILLGGVLTNLLLNVLDIVLVCKNGLSKIPYHIYKTMTVLTESGRLSILEDHQINVLFITQAQTGKHFERATGDTTLVGTRVLEKNDTLLLKP